MNTLFRTLLESFKPISTGYNVHQIPFYDFVDQIKA